MYTHSNTFKQQLSRKMQPGLSQAVHVNLQWIHVLPQYHIIKPQIWPSSDLGSKSKYESHKNRFATVPSRSLSLNSTSSAQPHPTFTLKDADATL